MKFLEHKAREICARYGIPVPRGIVASKPEEITDPPLPCMVKAQVLVGGRGKAGGIRPAQTLEEARQVAGQILGMDIHGYRVKQVYLEERLSIAKELYLGLTIDRSAREPLLMATAMGGMDVEEVPREDANLDQDRTPLEQEAHDKGIVFIQLDGDIGVIANGAGLTMATLDALALKGGRGGVFLDLGGTDDPAKVKQAFELLIKANPSVILVNIFGGITKADPVATGVKQAIAEMHAKVPVVARIKGVNEAVAKEILRSVGTHPAETIEEAAELAVRVKLGGP